MVCHLADALRMATGDRPASPATGILQQTMIKWTALYAPLRWPVGIPTSPEIDQEQGGTKPADFARDVAEVTMLLELFARRQPTGWASHPIFGRMSHRAWLRWGYLHTDHHLRQFGE